MNIEEQWNDIERGKLKNSEKILSQCHFVHHRSHWTDLGANLGHRGEKPATNRLSYGTALMYVLVLFFLFPNILFQ
jgi:hypothetical protein